MLAELIRGRRAGRTVVHEPELEALTETLIALTETGDLVLTLGAGSITRTSYALVELLNKRTAS